jgi:hypothetical protein
MNIDARLKQLENKAIDSLPIVVHADNPEEMTFLAETKKKYPSYDPVIIRYEDA